MTPQFKNYVKNLALRCGFKLKEQGDGAEDLNPYVYHFAEELLQEVDALTLYAVILRSGSKLELIVTFKGKPTFRTIARVQRLKRYSGDTLETLLKPIDGVIKGGVEGKVSIDNYNHLELVRLVAQEKEPE